MSRIENGAAHVHPVGRGQLRGRAMSAECDGVLERGNEDFAIRTGPHMLSNLPADVGREFVVDVCGQLPEKINAMASAMVMPVWQWSGLFLFRRGLFLGHESESPDVWSS